MIQTMKTNVFLFRAGHILVYMHQYVPMLTNCNCDH